MLDTGSGDGGFVIDAESPLGLGAALSGPPKAEEDSDTPAETPATEPADPEPKPDPEPSPKYSKAAALAKEYQKSGYLPEDFEVSDDLGLEDFKKATFEHFKSLYATENDVDFEEVKAAQEVKMRKRLAEEGLTEEAVDRVLEWSKHFERGGSPQAVASYVQYKAAARMKLETQEEKEAAIKAMHKAQNPNMSAEDIDALISAIPDEKELTKKAEAAQTVLDEIGDKLYEADRQRAQKEREAAQAAEAAQNKKVADATDTADFGIDINDAEKTELKAALTQKTEVIEQDGDRFEVTKFAKQVNDIDRDPQTLVFWAYLIGKGKDWVLDKFRAGDVATSAFDQLTEKEKTVEKERPKQKTGNPLELLREGESAFGVF